MLEGRVALVTGSSRGIGAAIAVALARNGAAVAVHGRDTAAIGDVVQRIRADGHVAFGIAGDVRRQDKLVEMSKSIEAKLGPLDILVANAGGNLTPPAMLEDTPEAGFMETVHENLSATFLTLKTFLPSLKDKRHGAIVTIASAAARRPSQQTPIAYAAAKAGIIALTRIVSAQAGPFGVRTNCVAPETILTERNETQIPQAIRGKLVENNPLRRLGRPEDVADAVVFLASDHAAWINGVVIDVAGGTVLA